MIHEAGLDPSHGGASLDEVTVSPAGFGFILTSTKPAPLPSRFYPHCSNQALIIRRTLITIINCARQVDEASESFNQAIHMMKCGVVVTQREREKSLTTLSASIFFFFFFLFTSAAADNASLLSLQFEMNSTSSEDEDDR